MRRRRGNRTLVLLAGVFVLMAVVVIWQRVSQEQAGERLLADVPGDPLLPGLLRSDIQAVRIEVPGGNQSFTVARGDDGTWTAPGYAGEFDPAQGEAIAATIPLLPYYRRLEGAADGNLATYGFTPLGTLLVQVVLRDGTQYAIAVGSLTPAGDTYYAVIDQQPDVYVVERRAIDYLFVLMRDATA